MSKKHETEEDARAALRELAHEAVRDMLNEAPVERPSESVATLDDVAELVARILAKAAHPRSEK